MSRSRTALVLVDVVPPAPADPDIFDRLGTALRSARRSGVRVVHVWSAPPGAPPPATHPDVVPVAGEPVLPNAGGGAWSGAGLGRTLLTGGVDRVALAGQADSPAWWPTVAEAAAQHIAVEVLSDRDPAHDARARGLLDGPGRPIGAGVVDVGSWVAGLGSRRPTGRRRRPLVTAVAVVVVALVAAVALVIHDAGAYYEFTPGTAPTVTASVDCRVRSGGAPTLSDGLPCARLIVPTDRVHPTSGQLFMVDVLVGPASPLDFALDKLHLLATVHPGYQLVSASAVTGGAPSSQLACQDAQQMSGSTQDAAVAALDRLGYPASANQLGAQVVEVSPGSAADSGGLHCNDLVIAVGSTAVHTSSQLVAAIRGLHPGDKAPITVRRAGANGTLSTVTVSPTLRSTPARPATATTPAQRARPGVAFLGVSTQTRVTYSLPFPVSVDVGTIGGPSAGLALTLGLLDVLSNGHLTGGLKVAATGTIAPDGTVGDVGGVAQKAIAVRDAGAQLFLVPPQEFDAARRAGGSLQVVAVSSLGQALATLQSKGGTLPPTQPATPGPGTTTRP